MTFIRENRDDIRPMRRSRKERERLLSWFETAPAFLFYLPVAAWWGLLSLRYMSPTLPTLANPSIQAGGLCGESKSAVLDLLGPTGRRHLARFTTIRRPGDMAPRAIAARLEKRMAAAGISYPVVAKPDIGRNGRGVVLVSDRAELIEYVAGFPAGLRLMVQELAREKGEAGVFWVREPGAAQGRITSVTLKFFPSVTGDGRSTLRELILADPRAGRVSHYYLPRFRDRLDTILPEGEEFPLVFTGNHCQGAIFRNGEAHVTEALTRRIGAIAREIEGFHFGRFDIRYESLEALERGEGFTIIELNGTGSESTHIWDAGMTLRGAYRTLFAQVSTAFRIGSEIRRRYNLKPMPPIELLRLYLGELALMRRYPQEGGV